MDVALYLCAIFHFFVVICLFASSISHSHTHATHSVFRRCKSLHTQADPRPLVAALLRILQLCLFFSFVIRTSKTCSQSGICLGCLLYPMSPLQSCFFGDLRDWYQFLPPYARCKST
ncbi:hypothetical protein ACQKWADRAFT_299364 [Trichoderma austrokoningii]